MDVLARATPLLAALPRAATGAKAALGLLLLANARSAPLAWHARVWWPVLVLQWRFQLFRLRILFKSRAAKKEAVRRWVEALSPVGSSPFGRQFVYRSWAGASRARRMAAAADEREGRSVGLGL